MGTTTIHSDDEDSDIAEALRLSRLAQETVIIDSDFGEDDDDVIIEDAFQGVGDGETASMERRNRRRLSDDSNEDEDDENSSSSSSSTQTSAAATSVLKAKVWDFLESARIEREIADRARVAGKENRGWDAEEEEEEMALRKRKRSPSTIEEGGGVGENGAKERDKSPRKKKGSGSG